MASPRTLLEAARHFSDPETCTQELAKIRWPDGPTCPRCASKSYSYLKTRRLWKCRDCQKQYSVKVGTIFEQSPIPLDKWMLAAWLLANCKNGVSSYELARDIGVCQKTGWFMLQRLRLAMQTGSFVRASERLGGEVEVDETFIGGKARNMHASRRAKYYGPNRVNPEANKTVVFGMLERGGRVRAVSVPDRRRDTTRWEIRDAVNKDATIYSDAAWIYNDLGSEFDHKVIDHAQKYVDGKVHINGLENFWSLLKRGLGGTYVSVRPFHLFRYLDEQTFRYNRREGEDYDRFVEVLSGADGKRVTWDALTGKAGTKASAPA